MCVWSPVPFKFKHDGAGCCVGAARGAAAERSGHTYLGLHQSRGCLLPNSLHDRGLPRMIPCPKTLKWRCSHSECSLEVHLPIMLRLCPLRWLERARRSGPQFSRCPLVW
eukprot:scaffold53592_cov35-Tisochrysis_lutea.AAC.2